METKLLTARFWKLPKRIITVLPKVSENQENKSDTVPSPRKHIYSFLLILLLIILTVITGAEVVKRDLGLISSRVTTYQVDYQRSVCDRGKGEGKTKKRGREKREAGTYGSPTMAESRKKAQLLVWTWGPQKHILGIGYPGYFPTFIKYIGIKEGELCCLKPKRMFQEISKCL